MSRAVGTTAALLLLAGAMAAPAQVRSGGEIRVNEHTTGPQARPAVAIDAGDNFVVVWDSPGQDGDLEGVFLRRFDASGSALTPELLVNTHTTDFQRNPAIAMKASGEFVVVWQGFGQDGSYGGILARRFDAAGTPLGDEFPVNEATTNAQRFPAVAMDASGGFVVVWSSYDLDSLWDVWGRRFDAEGTPVTADFRVNEATLHEQQTASVAADAAGNFVVAWESYQRGVSSSRRVFSRRFDAAATPQGPDFELTSAPFSRPKVAMSSAGDALVVFHRDLTQVWARGFDSSGAPRGPAKVLKASSGDYQLVFEPNVAADDAGHFVVAWREAPDYDTDDFDSIYLQHVRARRYDADGTAIGPESVASTYWHAFRDKSAAVVASRNPGRFVVAWQSDIQDGSGDGVFARSPDVIFTDAFELGLPNLWTSVSADGGDLGVSGAAKMGPSSAAGLGLWATVDDTAAVHVEDASPAGEPRYRARFYFDPNGFDPGESTGQLRQKIFLALSEAPTKRLVLLMLRRMAGQYAIGAQVRRDDDTLAKTAFFDITDGPHAIEIDWQKATAPGASDGRFEMWIDGTSVVTVTGLDNDERPVDLVRMGAVSVKAGAAGTLYFDEFVSRRLAYIGP